MNYVRPNLNTPIYTIAPIIPSITINSGAEQARGAAPSRARGLTEHGERIPPIAGDSPCDGYDPAGPGAGVEADGHPQCARCGFTRAGHEVDAKH